MDVWLEEKENTEGPFRFRQFKTNVKGRTQERKGQSFDKILPRLKFCRPLSSSRKESAQALALLAARFLCSNITFCWLISIYKRWHQVHIFITKSNYDHLSWLSFERLALVTICARSFSPSFTLPFYKSLNPIRGKGLRPAKKDDKQPLLSKNIFSATWHRSFAMSLRHCVCRWVVFWFLRLFLG